MSVDYVYPSLPQVANVFTLDLSTHLMELQSYNLIAAAHHAHAGEARHACADVSALPLREYVRACEFHLHRNAYAGDSDHRVNVHAYV